MDVLLHRKGRGASHLDAGESLHVMGTVPHHCLFVLISVYQLLRYTVSPKEQLLLQRYQEGSVLIPVP